MPLLKYKAESYQETGRDTKDIAHDLIIINIFSQPAAIRTIYGGIIHRLIAPLAIHRSRGMWQRWRRRSG